MAKTETLYILELKIPEQDSRRIPVHERLAVGSSENSDLCIENYELAPLHCTFKDSKGILTVQNTGGDGAVVVGKQELAHGKMYIIDKGDLVKLNSLTFVVRSEQAEVEYVDDDGDEVLLPIPSKENKSEDENEDMQEDTVNESVGFFKNLFKKKLKENCQEEDYNEDNTAPRSIESGQSLIVIQPKKVKISPFLKQKIAGFFIRFTAFILNFFFLYAFYIYVIPSFNLESLFEASYKNLSPHLLEIVKLTQPILDGPLKFIATYLPENVLVSLTSYAAVKFALIYLSLEIFTNIILGSNLGLFILGATGSGSFLGKRIKSTIRSLLGLLTTPFIIFDLPVLIKRRSLKELLTLSQIEKRNKFLSLVLCFLLAPAVMIMTILWPLVFDPLLLKMPEFEVAQKVIASKRERNILTNSSYFNLRFEFFKKETINLIPALGRKSALLTFFDMKKAKSFQVERAPTIQLKSLFEVMYKTNPFLPKFSPEIYKSIDQGEETKLLNAELSLFITDSMGITIKRIQSILLEHGPYLSGLVAVRLKLLESLGITSKFKVTSYRAAKVKFLLIEEEAKNTPIYILPLTGQELTPIKITFKEGSRSFTKALIESSFRQAKALPRGFSFESEEVQSWDAFNLTDLFIELSRYKETKEDDVFEVSEISEETIHAVAAYFEEKIEVLKDPKGLSAKVKKSYENVLRNSIKKTSRNINNSELEDELKRLLDELPGKVIK